MDFDATKPFTDAEYNAFIDWLILNATEALRQARENQNSPDQAIRDYLTTAYTAGISAGEVVDFFGVSTPNIAETAGYIGKDLQIIMKRFDAINGDVALQFFK